MQGDAASTGALRRSLGVAIDRSSAARGTHQLRVVSIRADQGQGFGGAVLLDSLSCHVDNILRWKVDFPPDSTIFQSTGRMQPGLEPDFGARRWLS